MGKAFRAGGRTYLSWRGALGALACIVAPVSALASTFVAISEADPGTSGPLTTYFYPDQTAFEAQAPSSAGSSLGGLATPYSVGGLTWNGNDFLIIIEADPGGANDIFLSTFSSLATLTEQIGPAPTKVGLGGLATPYSIRGLAWNGSDYLMISEADPGGENKIFLSTFSSLANLVSQVGPAPTQVGIGGLATPFSIAGLTHDGGKYLMLVEQDPGINPPGDLFLVTFESLPDLIAFNFSSSEALGSATFGANRSYGGFTAVPEPAGGGGGEERPPIVPLPASGVLLLAALCGALGLSRRQTAA